jgi:hypothetical protein
MAVIIAVKSLSLLLIWQVLVSIWPRSQLTWDFREFPLFLQMGLEEYLKVYHDSFPQHSSEFFINIDPYVGTI